MEQNDIQLQNSNTLFTNENYKLNNKPLKDRKKYYNIAFIGFFFLCSSAFFIYIGYSKLFGLGLPESHLGISQSSTAGATHSIKFLEGIPVIGEFFNGKLQAKIEKGVTAYFGPREELLLANYEINNAMNTSFYKLMLPKEKLVPLDDGDNIRFLDRNHNILINLSPMDETYMTKNMNQSAKFFNNLYEKLGNKVGISIYGVTTPYHVPELNNEYDVTGYNAKGYSYLQEFAAKLNPNIQFKTLDVQTLKEYSELFFATDHHWNMHGAYKGYQEIMAMLGKADEIKKVEIVPLEGIKFRGSIARLSANESLYDTFYIPKVNLGDYDVVINSNPNSGTKLTKRDTLLENSQTNKFLSCYSEYFGEDFASVMYDFKQPSKGNLLTIGDSTTNCVDDLIASHYNKTYVLDLRLYAQKYGHKFNISSFIKENDIKDVLFLTQSQGCLIDNSPNIIVE